MNFIDFLQGWYAGWSLDRDSPVHIQLVLGNKDFDKKAATIGAESSETLGTLTVWDTGELDLEVVSLQTSELTLLETSKVVGPEDFSSQLAKFMLACGGRG